MSIDLIEQFDDEMLRKREIMEMHLEGALLLMESLEGAAERARAEVFGLNPYTEADKIRERQIICALVERELPRILENIMNAGDGSKVWRYHGRS